ncbi:hypothetical protein ASPBRDRAFT_56939 [Aspergillus brasiliensis CBS 101740]|uniref:Uncharacterized protein n=1 Tax=Aspergillus brasiliensis (strain CBS 101740 / IMI 381727 / IBT 21946) TaxID=767769 RepID=A0A1L9UF01_ASPBC|nr:hypothetical protein ASPBRDRAFT_56939 [Aspergillus brasiliensis CBS 101740]
MCISCIALDPDDFPQECMLEYASTYWDTHFRQAQIPDEDPVIGRAMLLCEPNSDIFRTWSRIYEVKTDIVPESTSPLLIASCLGLIGVLLLATEEVNVNLQDPRYGRSPLAWAAGQGHEGVVKLLLATGKVDVDSRSTRGHTPLSWVAWEGHETVVNILLATGEVDVNSKDLDGRTPLSWAAENGNEAVIKLLIARGKADVHARDGNERTPLDWVAENDHQGAVDILRMYHYQLCM